MTASASAPFVATVRELVRPDAPATDLADSRKRVPFADVVDLFSEAAATEPAFGLRFADSIKPGTFGALGYAAMTCDTLSDALPLIPRYGQLVFDFGSPIVRIVEEADDIGLIWEPEAVLQPFPWAPDHPGFRAVADAIIGGWFRFGCWITSQCKAPSRVQLRAPMPADPAPWADFFMVPVEWNAPRHALWFPREYLGLPLSQADRAMHQAMRQEADILLAALVTPDVVREVAETLVQRLAQGDATLEAVAARLGTSPRTLQRRLAEAGTPFQAVLNDTRRRLAERYLAQPQWSLLDVALLLGYSDQSAFTRAFKGWSGMVPSIWRSQQRMT